MSHRARDVSRNLCFSSFHSLSYSSTVRWIELRIELGIDLRINNARRTVLARVSGLVNLFLHFFDRGFSFFFVVCTNHENKAGYTGQDGAPGVINS